MEVVRLRSRLLVTPMVLLAGVFESYQEMFLGKSKKGVLGEYNLQYIYIYSIYDCNYMHNQVKWGYGEQWDTHSVATDLDFVWKWGNPPIWNPSFSDTPV